MRYLDWFEGRCPMCHAKIGPDEDVCILCRIAEAELPKDLEDNIVSEANAILQANQQHYTLRTVKEIRQWMIDMQYEDDLQILTAISQLTSHLISYHTKNYI